MVPTPDLNLRASLPLSGLTLLLHGAVVEVLVQLGGIAYWLIPVALVSGVCSLLLDGLRCLPWSVQRVWLGEDGWYWQRRNGAQVGPCLLGGASRVDSRFIRLSLRRRPLSSRHLLITAGMTGAEAFRQLQVFLRWAPDKNHSLGR